MAPRDNDDKGDERRTTRRNVSRRNVLMAVGAGSALAGAGGFAASAQQTGTGTGTETESDPGTETEPGTATEEGYEPTTRDCQITCIDEMFGANGTDPTNIARELRADHQVRLRIADRDRVYSEDVVGGEDTGFPDFVFNPVGLRVRPGETVRFNCADDVHTVTPYHPNYFYESRIPEGVPGFTSSVLTPDTFWLYAFDVPGVYDLMCLPHEGLGMVMRVVCVGEGEPTPEAAEILPYGDGGPSEPAAAVLQTDVMQPENVVEAGRVLWTDLPELGFEPPFGAGGGSDDGATTETPGEATETEAGATTGTEPVTETEAANGTATENGSE